MVQTLFSEIDYLHRGGVLRFCRELVDSIAKLLGVGTRVEAARLPTTPGLLWMLESSAVVERRRIIRNLIAQGGRDAVKLLAAVSNICG